MKKKSFLLFFLFVSIELSAQWDFGITATSRYVWRGFDLLLDNNPALQPSLTYTFGESGFSINAWGSFALKERDDYQDADEMDITVNYDLELKNITLSAGLIHYGYYFEDGFSFKDSTTQEFYLGIALDGLWVEPRLVAYYDIHLGDGLYLEAGASREFAVSESLGLSLDAWMGYNNGQWQVKKGFSDLNLRADLAIPAGSFTIQPFIWFCKIFNDEVNENNSEFIFGLKISFSKRTAR